MAHADNPQEPLRAVFAQGAKRVKQLVRFHSVLVDAWLGMWAEEHS